MKEIKKKLKPLIPSLRERKRYVVFKIVSNRRIKDFSLVSRAIWRYSASLIGTLGQAKAGIWVLEDKLNPEKQTGMVRVNHKHVNELKASLALIDRIGEEPVIVKSLSTSLIALCLWLSSNITLNTWSLSFIFDRSWIAE